MEKEYQFKQMETSMKVIGKIMKEMDMDNFNGKMEINMKVNGIVIRDLVRGNLYQKKEIFTMDNGKMIKEMDKVLKFMMTGTNTQELGE